MSLSPTSIDLKKDASLTIVWEDGSTSQYTIAYLRRMSPSADVKQLRDEMAKNPLAVLPASTFRGSNTPLTALGAELVGNYALKIRFSDGHESGIYSWPYLLEIDPARGKPSTL